MKRPWLRVVLGGRMSRLRLSMAPLGDQKKRLWLGMVLTICAGTVSAAPPPGVSPASPAADTILRNGEIKPGPVFCSPPLSG